MSTGCASIWASWIWTGLGADGIGWIGNEGRDKQGTDDKISYTWRRDCVSAPQSSGEGEIRDLIFLAFWFWFFDQQTWTSLLVMGLPQTKRNERLLCPTQWWNRQLCDSHDCLFNVFVSGQRGQTGKLSLSVSNEWLDWRIWNEGFWKNV